MTFAPHAVPSPRSGLGLVAVAATARPRADELKVGDKAPDFTLKGPTARPTRSPTSRGRRPSSSPGSPRRSPAAAPPSASRSGEKGDALKALNVAYFTASVDAARLQQEVRRVARRRLPDPERPRQVGRQGLRRPQRPRGFANRWTFYIDKDGMIAAIDKKINTKKAAPDVAAKVKELGLASK